MRLKKIRCDMAKQSKDVDTSSLKNVEEKLSKTEQFIESNYKFLLGVLIVVVALVGLFWLGKMFLNNRDEEAKVQMFQAERYFELDSLSLALNGDGNYYGFIDVSKDYKLTNTGNLAKYCAGICYLHLGDFENAIKYLEQYKKKDKVLGSLAIGAAGDAYVELDQLEKGIDKYLEAAEFANNSFNTPLYLMKAGEIYELSGEYSKALSLYEEIKSSYPESTEGISIDKYIARVKLLIK